MSDSKFKGTEIETTRFEKTAGEEDVYRKVAVKARFKENEKIEEKVVDDLGTWRFLGNEMEDDLSADLIKKAENKSNDKFQVSYDPNNFTANVYKRVQ